VAQQSEEEYVQKAVEASLKYANVDDDLLQEAIKQSLQQCGGQGMNMEESDLQAAIAASRAGGVI